MPIASGNLNGRSRL